MNTRPVSIFSKLGTRDILDRLSGLRRDALKEGQELPEGSVRALLAALEAKLPEIAPDLEEIPSGRPTPDAVQSIL